MQREIGIIIKVKDAAKAKAEIEGIIGGKILGNVGKFNNGMREAGESTRRAAAAAKEAKGGFDKLFLKMTTGMGALYALKRGFGMVVDSFEQGAGLERAAAQFENSIGKVDKILPTLRSATRGTVDDMKLLATANRAVMEGLDPKKLTSMYKMATVASRKLGLDTETSIQTISNAISHQDEAALTTLGTILKTNIEYKIRNALIAKNGGVMSGAMAVASRHSVIMNELNKKFGGFNQLQEDSVELLQRFRASMDNLKMSLGQALGSSLAPLLRIVVKMADGFSELLKTVKDNKAFKAFIQYASILAGIFTAKGIIGGIMLAAKHLGIFIGGLKTAAILAGGFISFKVLGIDLESISRFAEKAQTAFSVFFQLLNNYDEETGMSSVLTKDKEALGGFFKVVFQAVKVFMVLKAAATGVFEGIGQAIRLIAPVFGDFGKAIINVLDSLSSGDPLLQSTLDTIKNVAKWVGIATGAIGVMLGIGGGFLLLAGKVTTAATAVIGFAAAWKEFAAIRAGGSSLQALIELSKDFGREIVRLTAKLWAMATARLAAMGPIGLAIAGVAAVVGGGYMAYNALKGAAEEKGDVSNTNSTTSAPAPRAHNVDNLNNESPALLAILKEQKKTSESNQQMNTREEQRDISQRTQTAGKFY